MYSYNYYSECVCMCVCVCAQILEEQIQDIPEISFEKLGFSKSSYPPNVSFTVSHNRENDQPPSQLNSWIEAQGAFNVNGESLSFSVTSTKPINTGLAHSEDRF